MRLNELSDKPGAVKARKRVGRGIGSGKGKTSGRGVKGQNSRAGVAQKGFEGGQMPLHRRLPKRGFTNIFRKDYAEVGLDRIQAAIDAGRLDAAQAIDVAALKAAGIVKRVKDGVRLLGGAAPKVKLNISVAGASRSAVAAVEQAGGSVTLLAAPKDDVAGEAAAKPKKARAENAKAEDVGAGD